jgi:iron(III) transport system substrate-binding protein
MTATTARFRALVFALLSCALAACGRGADTLVLYSPHGRELLAVVEEAYEAEHPGLDVRWLDMGSQEVYDRVRSERANPQADVWFGGPSTIFARGAAEGLLAPFRPGWADAVPPELGDPDDRFFAAYRTAPVILYNSLAVTGDSVPADWDDLLAERFAQRIVIRDPLASGTMRTFFGLIVARSVARTGTPQAGFEWLARLDVQTKEYVLNPALMIEKLQRQEGLVTVWELTDALWQEQRGAPLAYVFPASGTPIIADSIGVVAGAPHPAEAERFVEWVGGPAAQRLAAERSLRLPARNDLPRDELPEWTVRVLDAIVPATVDGDLVARFGDEWMKTWDRSIRGRGAEFLAVSRRRAAAAEASARRP